MRICQPKKVIFTNATNHRSHYLVLLYDFSTVNENVYFHFCKKSHFSNCLSKYLM